MEKTPFDEAQFEPPAGPLPVTEIPSARLGDEARQDISPPAKKRSKWPVAVGVLVLAAVGGAGGYQVYKNRLEEQRLAGIRDKLKGVVLEDNALVQEVLGLDKSSNITYAEFFKRTDKNKDEREDLIRTVRATEADIYTDDAQKYIKLLNLENDWVRGQESMTRAEMDASSKIQTVKDAMASATNAKNDTESAREAYMQAPYGEDYNEKMELDLSASRFKAANGAFKDALDDCDVATKKADEARASAALNTDDWLKSERLYYPLSFAPPRDISDDLIKWKQNHGGGSDEDGDKDKQVKETAKTPASSPAIVQTAATATIPNATATAVPQVPTRDHSSNELSGERFPQTRMRKLETGDLQTMTDDDIQYAINEMYARYGMTFKDKTLQAEFAKFSWYRPNEKWTMSQVQKAFNKTETYNLTYLTDERNLRRSGGTGM